MKISIIIPVLNEAASITKLLSHLTTVSKSNNTIEEILVIDGGSIDGTQNIIKELSNNQITRIKLVSSEKGRAKQMNTGAAIATGDIFYFLHADTFPPKNYDQYIINEVQKGNEAGCFRMKFNSNHWLLQFLGWLTKFKSKLCRGGDQSLFITRSVFDKINGYDESYIVYEDNDLVDRLFIMRQFVIIPEYVITSARRYEEIGVWRLQYHFLNIHMRRWMGASSQVLYRYYKEKVIS